MRDESQTGDKPTDGVVPHSIDGAQKVIDDGDRKRMVVPLEVTVPPAVAEEAKTARAVGQAREEIEAGPLEEYLNDRLLLYVDFDVPGEDFPRVE